MLTETETDSPAQSRRTAAGPPDDDAEPAAPSPLLPGAQLPAAQVLDAPVLCADGLRRCPWSLSGPHVLVDHDTAWGLRPSTPDAWMQALSLEILQAGLAPGAAVSRLPALEEALRGFDPEAVALMDDDSVDELLLDRRLIRNRAKLTAVVLAARSTRTWQTGDWEEVLAPPPEAQDQDPVTHVRGAVQRLRGLGVVHAGPGTVARLLARTGMVPGHLEGCFRS